MGTTRFFNGTRDSGKRGMSREDIKFYLESRNKLTATQRWKRIRDKKFAENKKNALGSIKTFSIPGTLSQAYKISKNAENALKQMAQKKAAKEAKALRQMVVVQQRTFPNGRIVKDGKIFDIAGNIVAKVDTKTGKMTTGMGWSLGKYKPKSFSTNTLIQQTIDKYSPYYINLRKMQAMQQGEQFGVWGASGQDAINIYGRTAHSPAAVDNYGYARDGSGMFSGYGSTAEGPRQNVGVTAWGAMSDNTWGTFADNVWGTSSDTVWGTNTSDVWGGIGGSPFGNGKSVQIWGTGNGHNYLKGLGARVAAFFGIGLKSQNSRAAFHQNVRQVQATRSSGRTSGGGAPTTTRAPVAPRTSR